MSWESNAADQIALQLQEDGHQKWGFVIYRTTYESDNDWAEFIRRLRYQMDDVFEYLGGRDVLQKFKLTVIEDRNTLDGASTDHVRRHFQQWAIHNYRLEQSPSGNDGTSQVAIGRSSRYRYALQVDGDALHSLVHEAPDPADIDTTSKGWVKLIDKSWYLGRSEGGFEVYEPIEGVTERDVGWMQVAYQDVMSEWYVRLRSYNYWSRQYRRPPQILS